MPIIAAGLAELRHGSFSFFPAIVGVHHNEWILRRATWTDIVVANAKTSEEICIPRRFVGEVSSIEAPYRIVGLVKELEFREGVVLPHRRVVLEMPRAVGDFSRSTLRPTFYSRPAGVVAIRAEPDNNSRLRRALRGSIAAGFLACLAVIFVVRDAHLGGGFGWNPGWSRLADLNAGDDFNSITRKFGSPASDRWIESQNGAGGYRRLWYPRRGVTLILTGASGNKAHYAGTLNRNDEIIHSVDASLANELYSSPVIH